MNGNHNFSPVKQANADEYLLAVIASFGITVIAVRIFLNVTGYPQIGDSTLHVAHVLWGGLLLFIAVVVDLIFSNPWAHWLSSILGGCGAGLFIDEVGKFITQNNDYFYPLAFPIIYSFIVICIWLYLRVRRSDARDTRTLFYHSLENLKESLDNDLDVSEESDIVQDLRRAAQTAADPGERKLAIAMLEFVKRRERQSPFTPNWFERVYARVLDLLVSKPPRRVFQIILVIGFALLGVNALAKLVGLYGIASSNSEYLRALLAPIVVVNGKSQYVVDHPVLLITHIVFITAIGIFALISAVLIGIGKERFGLRIGLLGLVFALSIVNPLIFYFSQLYAVVDALGELTLVGLAQLYRWRFYLNPTKIVHEMAREAQ